jgi:hypothetical protein
MIEGVWVQNEQEFEQLKAEIIQEIQKRTWASTGLGIGDEA